MTENELIEALRSAMAGGDAGPDDAHTVMEMCELTGHGQMFIRKHLKLLLNSGRAEMVRVNRQSIDGRIQRLPAYRIKAA